MTIVAFTSSNTRETERDHGGIVIWVNGDGGTVTKQNGRSGRRVKPYSTGEAALELGVSQRTVIRLCEAGEIDFVWSPGHGRRRIPVTALERYRKANP